MTPAIIKLDEIRGIGYEITEIEYERGSEKNGAAWGELDFSKYPAYPAYLHDEGELSVWRHPKDEKVRLAYYFGCKSDTVPVPEGFTEFIITAGEYAVFVASNSVLDEKPADTVAKVRSKAAEIFRDWLGDASGYVYDIDHGMMFEYYKDNTAFICVPVKKA